MKGLWKKNVSIWHKDSKRKKTKFKHIVKDNLNIINKRDNLPEYLYREEKKLVKIGKRKEFSHSLKNTNYKIPIYKLRIYKNFHMEELIGTTHGYLKERKWVEIGNKNLLEKAKKEKLYIYEIHIGFIENPDREENIKYNNEIIERPFEDSKIPTFIYNKPSPLNQYSYIRHYRKKPFQTMVDRITRRIVKRWINKGEFEEVINFNPLQKSIKWLIL